MNAVTPVVTSNRAKRILKGRAKKRPVRKQDMVKHWPRPSNWHNRNVPWGISK